MSTLTPKRLGAGMLAASSWTTLYTVPADTKALVRQVMACNVVGTSRTYSVAFVKPGEDANGAGRIISDFAIASPTGAWYTAYQASLTAGTKIQGKASVADSINLWIMGVELTNQTPGPVPTWMAHANLNSQLTTVYTVPAGKKAIVKRVTVCNRDDEDYTFDIAVVRSGQTMGNGYYLWKGFTTQYTAPWTIALSMALAAGDTIRAKTSYTGSSKYVALNIWGSEIDV